MSGAPSPERLFADRFRLGERLGQGGMGTVYRAVDVGGREVALKLLSKELSEAARARLRREGELTAALKHPGIVAIHSAGEADGVPWLAYELVPGGRTLGDALPELPVREKVALVAQAARALGHAHARGVIHRDVKPGNVLLTPEGQAKVADFGLAWSSGVERLTRSAALLGTPFYMSPEQLAGLPAERLGPAVDVWALGVILYQALSGELPFPGPSLHRLAEQVSEARPASLATLAPDTPPALAAVCARAMARAPGERYPDAGALAADLEAWLEGRTPSARPVRPRALAGVAALLVLVAVGGALARRPARPAPAAPEPAPATALLELEPPPERAWGEALQLRGRAAPQVSLLELSSPGGAVLQLRGGQTFQLEVPLQAGPNRITLQARSGDGRREEHALACYREEGPAWLGELPPSRRPPLPLPRGLEFGSQPGEYRNAPDGSLLVYVPPGTFQQGSTDPVVSEAPREVTLTRGFFIGKLEVTVAQWRRFCEEAQVTTLGLVPEGGDQAPACALNWEQARAYCAWAGGRLPTEAEWEYAARGGDGRRYPWGDEPAQPARCNMAGPPFARHSPVGAFPGDVSPFGCLDLAGNVSEWTADWFAPYGPGPVTDPHGPPQGERRVVRGGAWNDSRVIDCRAEHRAAQEPQHTAARIGLRLVRDAN